MPKSMAVRHHPGISHRNKFNISGMVKVRHRGNVIKIIVIANQSA